MKKKFITMAACLLCNTALADTLILKNNDRISGTVLSTQSAENLKFKTSFGQDIYVPWVNVSKLYDIYNRPIKRPDITYSYASSVQKQTEPPKAKKAPAEAPKEAPSGIEWSGRANVGATLQEGNSDNSTFNADTTVNAKWKEKHRVVLKAEYNYEEDDGDVTEDNQSLDINYDYFFNKKWFSNSTVGLEQDDLSDIDLRTIIGAGLGFQAFEQKDLNLKFIMGGTYLRQDFESTPSDSSIALRWYSDYDQKFWKDALQIFHNHEIIVPEEDTEDFLVDSSTGIRVPLKIGLVGTVQVDFDWDNRPEPGVVEDDTQYMLKLGYEWQ